MITVLPDPAGRAGTAQMRVGGAAAAAAVPGLRIRREGWDQGTLGPNGWQGEDALLQPDEVATDGADLLLTLGWPVCAHLEAGTYLFGVPRAGVDEPASWPDIRPVRAASRPRPPAPAPVSQTPAAEPAPMPLPVGPKPAPKPPVVPADPPVAVPPVATAGRSKLIALLPVLVLLLAGGGYWYWSTHRTTAVAGTTTEPIPPHPPVPEPPPAPSLADMSVPDVLSHAANPAAIAAEGQRRLAGPKRDEGMLLLEEAADRSDGSAMAALGALYDPVNFQPSPTLGKPDPRQAARYYRDAQHAGMPGIDAKRDALLAWLRARSANGDLQSDLIQRDFWP